LHRNLQCKIVHIAKQNQHFVAKKLRIIYTISDTVSPCVKKMFIIVVIIGVSSQFSLWILESSSVGVVHACVRLACLQDGGCVAVEHWGPDALPDTTKSLRVIGYATGK
jgi:hypothetical protein